MFYDLLFILAGDRQGEGEDAADALCADLAQRLPKAVQVRLPHLEAPTPDAIVRGLCDALAPHLDALLPGLAR